MELLTERLSLRPWRTEDAADLYEYARDERVAHAADWPAHRSVEESGEIIRTVFSAPEIYAVCLRTTGRPVGCIGLLRGAESHLPLPDDQAEVGYWIGVLHWGRGLIPEALEALIHHAFGALGLAALWCCAFTDNPSSQRVQQKCGFRFLRTEPAAPDSWAREVRVSCLTRDEAASSQRLVARKADRADIPLIRRLAGEAFPATYCDLLTPEQIDYMMEWMYSPESLERQLNEGHVFYLATVNGEPCGYVSVEQQEADLFHLQKIYVLSRFQGIGAGAFLFGQAVAHIRAVHPTACRMELNVNRHNRALHFYERMGMERLREGDFPIGNGYFMNDYILGLRIG